MIYNVLDKQDILNPAGFYLDMQSPILLDINTLHDSVQLNKTLKLVFLNAKNGLFYS